jgi:hypothetical protein
VLGTALTVPQGQVEIATRTVLPYGAMVSVSGGISPTTELWADAGASLAGGDGVRTYAAGLKQTIHRSRNVAISLVGSVRSLRFDGLFDDEGDGGTSGAYEHLAMAGFAVTYASDTGGVMVTAGLHGAMSLDHSTDQPALFETLGLSLGEANTRVLGELIHVDGGSLGFAGVRLGSNTTTFDAGAIFGSGAGLIPAPLLSLRTRL